MICRKQEKGYLVIEDEPRVCTLRRAANIIDVAFPKTNKRWKRDTTGLIAAVYTEIMDSFYENTIAELRKELEQMKAAHAFEKELATNHYQAYLAVKEENRRLVGNWEPPKKRSFWSFFTRGF
jgi:hypothetical protein